MWLVIQIKLYKACVKQSPNKACPQGSSSVRSRRINRTSHRVSDSVAPMGGSQWPPSEINEGVIFDPMLLYSICYLVYLGVTCKKLARYLKISARFQDFKNFAKWRFRITLTNKELT